MKEEENPDNPLNEPKYKQLFIWFSKLEENNEVVESIEEYVQNNKQTDPDIINLNHHLLMISEIRKLMKSLNVLKEMDSKKAMKTIRKPLKQLLINLQKNFTMKFIKNRIFYGLKTIPIQNIRYYIVKGRNLKFKNHIYQKQENDYQQDYIKIQQKDQMINNLQAQLREQRTHLKEIEIYNQRLKKDCFTLAERLEEAKIQNQQKDQTINNLQAQLREQKTQSKKMFQLTNNLIKELQQARGNIQVFLRIKPSSGESVFKVISQNILKISYEIQRNTPQPVKQQQSHIFQHIFDQNSNQVTIFTKMMQITQTCLDGKQICVYTYGQSGSGKTFTLFGQSQLKSDKALFYQNRGILQRNIQFLFKQIRQRSNFGYKYKVFLTCQQICRQQIIDLITRESTIVINKNTKVGFSQVYIKDVYQILAILEDALQNRKIASTKINQRSSRSHLLISIRLEGWNSKQQEINGSLVMIDLAGNERIKESGAEGQNKKQVQFINSSLSSLATVFHEMRTNSEHISFRNSILTKTLRRYLNKQTINLMIVNVSSDAEDINQTRNSLKFATRVRQVKARN